MGVTDCVSFGNPEKPAVFWQFKQAIEGLAEACEFFDAPVVSGNVSFYNETPETAIFPTPVVGMLGLIENVEARCTIGFKKAGDVVVLLAASGLDLDETESAGLGGSEYLKVIYGKVAGAPPVLDMAAEKRLHRCLLEAIEKGILSSAHDCSDGGIAIALAESCIVGGIGLRAKIPPASRTSAALFGEFQSRAIVSVQPDKIPMLHEIAEKHIVPSSVLGILRGDRLTIEVEGSVVVDKPIEELAEVWRSAIPRRMEGGC
jgi:phosphoribosylformylglycinamidine synthase